MAFHSKTERNAALREIVSREAQLRVGVDLENFAKRCERRTREELRARGISTIIIWWIIKFVLWSIIQEFFFSAEADRLRSQQA